jgi:hypothetical protein
VADRKLIAEVCPNAASNTSISSSFQVPAEFTHFFIEIPQTNSWCVGASSGVRVQGASTQNGTYRTIAYSHNPSTAVIGAQAEWISGSAATGFNVICEALQFSPPWARLQFVNTATAVATFNVYGRKFD